MDSQKNLISISCSLHPSEFIQRVSLDPEAEQQFYCFECILHRSDNPLPPSNLKTIKDFIDIAATHYAQNKRVITPDSQVPLEYITLLSEQSHHLEALNTHIEEEKKKVESAFSKITEETLSLINQKKAEYLYSLDQQLFNLRYWYIFFDKQVKKAHPTEDDISFLFPSKEDLINRVQKISNSTQLTVFVRNIKEDLNDKASTIGKKDSLDLLYKRLKELETEKPKFDDESLDISSFRESLQKFIAEQFDKLFVMQNFIEDVKNRDYPESKIISADDFKVLKSWLPKEFQNFCPKLIYCATKDGRSGNAFHSHCDGKGATITLIKAKMKKSNDVVTVGGFLDQSWIEDDVIPIVSSKAFIFSLTSKLKCQVIDPKEAAYGYVDHGPVFGGGYDLAVNDFKKDDNYCVSSSYAGSEKLFRNSKKSDTKECQEEENEGDKDEDYEDCDEDNDEDNEDEDDYDTGNYFKLLELEVYTVK